MAVLGKDRKFYICTSASATTGTWLEGEQSNSFSRSADTIEVSDKSTVWKKFISGQKSATADVTINLDDQSTSQQHSLLQSFTGGQTVYCFVGTLSTESGAAFAEGDFFEAVITAVNDNNEMAGVASRSISLQVTGAPTHYPSLG